MWDEAFGLSVLSMIVVGLFAFYAYYLVFIPRVSARLVAKLVSETKSAFPSYLNRKFIYEDYNADSKGYPCCLAYDGKNIIIMNSSDYAILGWDDIRTWAWQIQGVQSTTGGNQLANNLDDLIANSKAGGQSGFTVGVADINHPKWFFPTGLNGRPICEKWMEIFNQIQEGKLSIEHSATQ
ncbi:MAG: hypothetical protein ABF665_03300 [Gluconacetobacter sp.]